MLRTALDKMADKLIWLIVFIRGTWKMRVTMLLVVDRGIKDEAAFGNTMRTAKETAWSMTRLIAWTAVCLLTSVKY